MKLPFSINQRPKYEPIGNPETGQIYLKSIGARTSLERTTADNVALEESRFQIALLKLARQVSIDKEIEVETAVALVLSQDTESSDLLIDYLDQVSALIEFRAKISNFPDVIATVMIQNRIVYPVTAQGTEDNVLLVSELHFPINPKSRIKFPRATATVANLADVGDEQITLESAIAIKPGEVGFLIEPYESHIKEGDPTWEFKDTVLESEDLIDAIYEFYQRETIGEAVPEKKAQSRKQSKSSKNSPETNLSTGENSTSNVNPTKT